MKILAEIVKGALPLWEEPEAPKGAEEPAAPAPEAPKPEGVEAKPEGEEKPVAPAAPAPKPDVVPEFAQRRIDELTARLAAEREKNAKLAKPAAAPGKDISPDRDSEFEQRVEAAAAQRAQLDAFNKACTDARSAGDAEYGAEFGTRLNSILGNLVDRGDAASIQRYNGFLAAAIEVAEGDPKITAAIIHELGGDLNRASRVMSMTPVKLGAELAKMGDKLRAAPKNEEEETPAPIPPVSGAPKPITPVVAKGASHTAIDPSDPARADNIPIGEWMKRREAQIEASRGASRR